MVGSCNFSDSSVTNCGHDIELAQDFGGDDRVGAECAVRNPDRDAKALFRDADAD